MKIPYQLVAAVHPQVRWMQMYHAIQQGFPVLAQQAIDDRARLQVVCYGPSLKDTWKDLDPALPIMTVSGALKFLEERGITPTWHVQMDPRKEQPRFIDPPVPGVHYLMASVCPPETWRVLRDQKVTIWHTNCGDGTLEFLARHAPQRIEGYLADGYVGRSEMLSGGSHVGLCALHVAGKLGFRHFEIFGMDGSFGAEGERHAGAHPGKAQPQDKFWDAGRVTYRTNEIMANGVSEVINAFHTFPMFGVFHGHGLQQALIREAGLPNACCADEADKLPVARFGRAIIERVVWNELRAVRPASWDAAAELAMAVAEQRRAAANYDTGSISKEAMLLLRGLAHEARPAVAIEVGTFIGNSTMAIAAEAGHVYTCDRSNDCFPGGGNITTYPRRESTEMLYDLAKKSVRSSFFFFDGRIQEPDVPLILRLSDPNAVYVFDDYAGREKGVANVERLIPWLDDSYYFVGPELSQCRLALVIKRNPGRGAA